MILRVIQLGPVPTGMLLVAGPDIMRVRLSELTTKSNTTNGSPSGQKEYQGSEDPIWRLMKGLGRGSE